VRLQGLLDCDGKEVIPELTHLRMKLGSNVPFGKGVLPIEFVALPIRRLRMRESGAIKLLAPEILSYVAPPRTEVDELRLSDIEDGLRFGDL
jgi:hypothetical protein